MSAQSDLQIKADAAVLVIAAHPDDDVIGMGGTMARLVKEGAQVSVVYVAPGGRSTRSFDISNADMIKLRRAEATCAALEIIKAKSVRFLDLEYPEDAKVLPLWGQWVKQGIAAALDDFSPVHVYLPHPKDGHRTHRAVTRAVQELLWDTPAPRPNVYGYETWVPVESVDVFVDITEFEGVKREAIRCHQSQVRDKAYEEGIMGLNRYRAVFQNPRRADASKYAEVFQKLRE